MGFRDDTEAMRARIEGLEEELERARARVAELEKIEIEAVDLRQRVDWLEAELGKLKEDPKQKARREKDARKQEREREERERRAKQRGEGNETTSEPSPWAWLSVPRGILLGLGLVVVAPVVGLIGYLKCAPPTWTSSLAPPTIGLVDLDATPTPGPIAGTTVGTRTTPMGCIGYIPEAPHLVLETHAPGMFVVQAVSSTDTVLVVLGSDGSVACDDDSGGSANPRVATPLPAGRHRIWVGTYSDGESASFTLSITGSTVSGGALDDRGLAPEASPTHGVVHGMPETSGSYAGSFVPVTSATTIDSRCRGHLPTGPALVLELAERSYVRLDARGEADLVLFMDDARRNVRCDDDGGPGAAPMVAELLEPGRYRVWVGSYSLQTSPVPYTLSLHAQSQALAPSEPTPQGLAAGQQLSLAAAPGVVLDARCGILVGAAPAAVLQVADNLDVEVHGASTQVSLLVDGPAGALCLGPGRSTWLAGRHRVFVGASPEATEDTPQATLTAYPPTILRYTP